MKKVTVDVPATSANLGPGFDVLGIAVHLFNSMTVEATGWSKRRLLPSVMMDVQGEGQDELPRDASNLVVRAAARVFNQVHRWPRALKLNLVNHIPLSRGLGSSSSAIIGGMCAANRLLGLPLKEAEILNLATKMEGHPDNVTPALVGGFCISGIVKNETRYLKFPVPAGVRAVICSPSRPLATSAARRVLPSRIPFSDAVFTSSRVAFLIGALLQRRYDWLDFAMDDVLHQPPRSKLIPGLNEVISAAIEAGAWGAALSGAGSSVLAFSKPAPTDRNVGFAMQKAFAAKKIESSWQSLSLVNQGVRYGNSSR